jgi:hypothetical protein
MDISDSNKFKTFDSKHTIGITKILLLFILLVASPNSGNLLSKQMKEFIEDHRSVQHILAYLMLLVVIDISYPSIEFYYLIIYSIVVYILFLLSTKLDIHWNIIIFLLLFVFFIYENKLDHDQLNMINDKNLTYEEKIKIEQKNNYFKYSIFGLISFLIILGTFFYNNRKMVQYGGGYDPINYLFY